MNKHKTVIKTAGIIMATLSLGTFSSVRTAHAEAWRRAVSLSGMWKFEIGDNPQYCARDFDDSKWDKIRVPGAWENQGFPGYDGYAWYRRSFHTPAEAEHFQLYLQLGSIDDVDETYVNGKMVGYQGQMPPAYETAYNFSRKYLIPAAFLDPSGENVIAVRVYDAEIAGGITNGDVGIYYSPDQMEVAMPLNGPWKLMMKDEGEYA